MSFKAIVQKKTQTLEKKKVNYVQYGNLFPDFYMEILSTRL